LAGLHPVIQAVAAEVASLPENGLQDALGGAAFGADLAAMEHEGLEVRLFRT
jgi:urease accessory protein